MLACDIFLVYERTHFLPTLRIRGCVSLQTNSRMQPRSVSPTVRLVVSFPSHETEIRLRLTFFFLIPTSNRATVSAPLIRNKDMFFDRVSNISLQLPVNFFFHDALAPNVQSVYSTDPTNIGLTSRGEDRRFLSYGRGPASSLS